MICYCSYLLPKLKRFFNLKSSKIFPIELLLRAASACCRTGGGRTARARGYRSRIRRSGGRRTRPISTESGFRQTWIAWWCLVQGGPSGRGQPSVDIDGSAALLYTVWRPLGRDVLLCYLSEILVPNWAAQ